MRRYFFLFTLLLSGSAEANLYDLPELYQDVIIQGEVVKKGVRECNDRYEAIREVLETLPKSFKSLDIGASQGYFSFRMADEFVARCTMIEDGYPISNFVWNTAELLKYLCEQNCHLKNLSFLQTQIFSDGLIQLGQQEDFDLVMAFAVIHHMKRNPLEDHEVYLEVIDSILSLAPVVLIENPINTGEHTQYIRKALQEREGKVIYQSTRGTLVYEIYLFDRHTSTSHHSQLPNLSEETYNAFHGTYSSIEVEENAS